MMFSDFHGMVSDPFRLRWRLVEIITRRYSEVTFQYVATEKGLVRADVAKRQLT